MLVLTRKKNDMIVIDGQIEIKILQINGSRIRLGINAPADTRIRRGELTPFECEIETPQPPPSLALYAEGQ